MTLIIVLVYYYYYYRSVLYCTLHLPINYVIMYNNLSNYILHWFWVVLGVVCTTMFLFVEVFLVSLHGD